ncbi:signal peptide peptidase SppA [Oceaniradius stylonematis]|uniref:signal peptide peptidase SppA n=1 Tax=Oceaniradius stylonematis TaxID=2184161 RepID=UPI0035CEF987
MEPLRADDIIDRQRMRRKLSFWRAITIIVIVAGLIALTASFSGDRFGPQTRSHVARIAIEGTITGDDRLLALIERVRRSEQAEAVIIAIDSPGGTTAGSEAVHDAVRKLAAEKPVVAQIDTLAASGGYMVAVAADRIVARQSSIVGSIGVIVQYPNFTGLLENWGVDVRAIKSTPLKAEPSFFGEPPEGAEEMLRALVMDSFDWFKELVAERRGFDQATIDRLADGSVYSGRVSLANGLVDELGGEDAARAWLTAQGIDEDLKIVRWEPRREDVGLFGLGIAAEFVAGRIGLSNPASSVTKALNQRLFLDGLISLWHADALLTSPTAEP